MTALEYTRRTPHGRPGLLSGAVRGFTLVEMAIVLAIMAVLVSVLMPDFIEVARNRLAQRTASDITMIQDAAKWYFVESAPADQPEKAHWPGEDDDPSTVCTPASGSTAATPMQVLLQSGYLRNPEGDVTTPLRNPWGADYVIHLVGGGPGSDSTACSLQVSTHAIPQELQGILTSALPQPRCVPDGTGLVQCSSVVPRPGSEASISYAINQVENVWIPQNVYVNFAPNSYGPDANKITIQSRIPGKRFMSNGGGYCQRVEVSAHTVTLINYPSMQHPMKLMTSPGTMYCYFPPGGGSPTCRQCGSDCLAALPPDCPPSSNPPT